jgi:hypothetical protein
MGKNKAKIEVKCPYNVKNCVHQICCFEPLITRKIEEEKHKKKLKKFDILTF